MFIEIVVNGFTVKFRALNIDRIQIYSANKPGLYDAVDISAFDTDDCSGNQFAEFLGNLLLM